MWWFIVGFCVGAFVVAYATVIDFRTSVNRFLDKHLLNPPKTRTVTKKRTRKRRRRTR